MSQWVYNYSEFKFYVGVVKSSFKKLILVIIIKPEAKWSNLEQVEKVIVMFFGGPNHYVLKYIWMTWD